MKKTAWILGSVEVILGLLTFIATAIIREVMPLIGLAAFQAAVAGSYSPMDYQLDFILPNLLGGALCLMGLATIIYFCFVKKD